MEDLHRDPSAIGVDLVRDALVVRDILGRVEPRRAGKDAALGVGRHATGDHEAHAAAGAGGIELGHPAPILRLLEPGMHRAHQHAVGQRHMPEVKGRQEVGILGHGSGPLGSTLP